MKVTWKTSFVGCIAHLNFLLVKSRLPCDELGELEQALLRNDDHRKTHNPVEHTLNLNVAKGNTNVASGQMNPVEMHPSDISTLDQAGDQIYPVIGLQSELGFPQSTKRKTKEFNFMGLSNQSPSSNQHIRAPLQSSSHSEWTQKQPIPNADSIRSHETDERNPEPQLPFTLSFYHPEPLGKKPKFSFLAPEVTSEGSGGFLPSEEQMVSFSRNPLDREKNRYDYDHEMITQHGTAPEGEPSPKPQEKGTCVSKAKGKGKVGIGSEKNKEFRQIPQRNDPLKLWKWICGVTLYIASSDDQEVKSANGSKISNFLAILTANINQVRNRLHPSKIKPEIIVRVDERFLQFSDLLWLVNLRLLRSLGKLEPGKYAHETLLVQEWILNRIFQTKEFPSELAKNKKETWIEPNLMHVWGPLEEALLSHKPTESIHFVIKKSGMVAGAISDSQAELTKAVVNVLACYYKSENKDKWKAIFSDERNFLIHIQRIQIPHLLSTRARTKDWLKQLDSLKLLPWKERPNGRLAQWTNLEKKVFQPKNFHVNIDLYVKDLNWLIDHEQDETNVVLSDEGLVGMKENENSKSKLKSKLSDIFTMMVEQRRTIETRDEFFITQFNSQLNKLKANKIIQTIDMRFSHSSLLQTIPSEKLEYFGNTLWVLNSIFITIMGYTIKDLDPIYFEEQKQLQEQFFHIITLMEDDEELPQSSEKDFKPEEASKMKQMLFNVLTSHEILNMKTGFNKSPSEGELIMMEAALNILAYHYKTSNCSKWFTLFHHKTNLITAFENYAIRKFVAGCYRPMSSSQLKSLQNLKLIPWKNTLSLDVNGSLVIHKFFRKEIYKD
ncbi:hypothetical protein PGT21_029445 [Puccinia graminis f. sp. tritici]|uniref:Golgi to ER traffic-protein n=1 Tax=Puccinia graminis f. sp. tritici TaxID=56615 RepID=A0A5B0Q7T9_PUCGR|nr:hypothetical protein PGT21_029445 [Puccinia graminis f. sp. tritici]KAA1109182.1 hypothetical protein PGTUg99_012650 [Puccinia graminis f. sp. tritici]